MRSKQKYILFVGLKMYIFWPRSPEVYRKRRRPFEG